MRVRWKSLPLNFLFVYFFYFLTQKEQNKSFREIFTYFVQ